MLDSLSPVLVRAAVVVILALLVWASVTDDVPAIDMRLGLAIILIGGIWASAAFQIDTSVEGKGFRVNDLGLMEQRRNHLLMASVTILAGVALFAFGAIRRSTRPK